ncbi:MAG: D-glycero-beta-D-manno-heptose 1-phosphate adenylyltransferase [Candidatus Wallbacteria bacterium HGW-Wallbacteria-1]|jgi:rfaE bifunctional protein nucleotidyltransferase chain/domain|uniref:D-glycero-beta-D-manno-heptose 1-phosphate adenylyltransferase n=1 Tax=Candidatus Wallbacteria bacterium HGW-Wallbacteria-1 TaxID=2013854 RepID=A0A2N1PUY5_9BACT|nr:MAG: D-glycero-beta-D-manno-heptose 1-phosphate adenylyltransferase [Candidatus Wallbacteria bacterium HGW-Wallbacteria-1]
MTVKSSEWPVKVYLNLDELAEAVKIRREAGETIVLANGCFDFLHVGHVRYLKGASNEGQCLLVAINSDESVQSLKGSDRPIVPEGERAEIVASFGFVDMVYIFGQRDVGEIIRTIRPDVHAKGTDYTAESVPEAELVRSCGGRVAIVGDPKNHDSSQMIKKLGGC